MNASSLSDWLPVHLGWREGRPLVEWAWFGRLRCDDPFFDQTVERSMQNPFNLLFRRETSMEALGELHAAQPGLPPAGFIFHLSRCGSTLVSRMLAALPRSLVISEARPVDSVLRANLRLPDLPDARRIEWLQWLVSALGRPRAGEDRHFIKFDCWNTLDLPLIQRAFPQVPWVFVYREPVEVMVSNLNQPAGKMFPGTVPPSVLDLNLAGVMQMKLEEYCARVLAKFCQAALAHHRRHPALLLNYRQLPGIVHPALTGHFGINCSTAEAGLMANTAQFNAKSPAERFTADSTAKNRQATGLIRSLTEQWLRPLYEQLETARLAIGAPNSDSARP